MRIRDRHFCMSSIAAILMAGLATHPPASLAATQGVSLTHAEITQILDQGVAQANREPSIFRPNATTRMFIYVVDRAGHVLDGRNMDDAWVGSQDIAVAKARTAAFFSSNQNALTSRTIGVLSQAHFPGLMDLAGPLWGIGESNQTGITGGPSTRNGLITFPGGMPLYKTGILAGGVGVSGDGVDQDEAVAIKASAGFEAPTAIQVKTVIPSLPYTTATPH